MGRTRLDFLTLMRSHILVTTLTPVSGSSKAATTKADIKRVVQESINKIGFIPDLFLIHSPFVPEAGKIGEFWTILEGLVEDGTLKGCSLGVSNFRVQDFEEVYKVCKIEPVVNRELQLLDRHFTTECGLPCGSWAARVWVFSRGRC